MTPPADLHARLLTHEFDAASATTRPPDNTHKPALLRALYATGWGRAAPHRLPDARPPASEADTDEALHARYAAGDSRAFELLYARLHPKVLAYARKCGCAEQAPDIAQDAFVALTRASEVAKVGAYLFTVVRNRTIDLNLRRTREALARTNEPPPDPGPSPFDALETQAEIDHLLALMSAHLPPEQQDMLLLFHAGHSADELATRFGLTKANLRVIRHRAHKTLRAVLEQEDAP